MAHKSTDTIKILFFAALREQAQIDSCHMTIPAHGLSLSQLSQKLVAAYPSLKGAFSRTAHIKMAVNQKIAKADQIVFPKDEVAFFPPMTGG